MTKPHRVRIPLILALGLLIQLGWARGKGDDVSRIGRRTANHRSIISQEKEVAFGQVYAQRVDRSVTIIKDPAVTEYIGRVAQNIARSSDLKVPLTVKVIDSPGSVSV